MEVFMHNLPPDLTEDGLKDQLAHYMKPLSIDDYSCDKPNRKRLGHITFLNRSDGERFLLYHGESINPKTTSGRGGQMKSNLRLSGVDVYCKASNRGPQDFALKALAHAAEERKNPSRIIEKEERPISLPILRYSCGYCTFIRDELTYLPEIQWADTGSVVFKKRNIIVKLSETNRLIRIPVNTVIELVWTVDGSLILTLSTVPLFFGTPSGTHSLVLNFRNSIPSYQALPATARSRLCSLDENHSNIVGQCLVYQLLVPREGLFQKMEQLKSYGITISFYNISIRYLGDFQNQLSSLKRKLDTYTQDGTLPFGYLFQLQALANNAYLPPAKVADLATELARLFQERRSAGRKPLSTEAIRRLLTLIDWPTLYGDPQHFEVSELLKAIIQSERDIVDGTIQRDSLLRPNQNLALIYRVMVTPSRITLHGPELEPKNRILRRFPNHHEYFVRVQFCDENGQDIHFTSQVNNDDVFTRFKNILKNGIQIAGRTYGFLGFSHSSLRSHSVWFSAPFFDDYGNLQTYFIIIKAIGKFTEIRCPAKCAARIGQAFSETPFAINLKDNGISLGKIRDVERDSRVFSDGVGTVSWEVVEAIRSVLPAKKGLPTCFQIRLGGAKGMLALDATLPGSCIYLRKSMIKFDSDDEKDLEICDVASKPIPLVLNRQVVKIMEDMGVSEEWFFDLQKLRVDQLRDATATTRSTAKFLKGQDVGESIRLYKLFLQLDALNIDYKQDPFLRSIVEAMVLRELRLLKHKARIPVPEGITLFGIMDETGFLKEGEVYVTFDTMGDRFKKPPKLCDLLVTRCPALHDGDVQMASHIIPPINHPLTKLKNCIVFSQWGNRDLPSQLSGGDLDGDLYNIIWDPKARPQKIFDPADYHRVAPVDIERLVNKEDMANFFVDFMQSDRLGVIATRHMILADQTSTGTSHPDCRKLAQLHSTAVDFSKTGIPVRMDEMPKASRYRPDFLAPGPQAFLHDSLEIELEQYLVQPAPDEDEGTGPLHTYYRSEKLLGKLYRAIDEHKIWNESIRTTVNTRSCNISFWVRFIQTLTIRCRALGAPAKWEHHIVTARQIRSAYEDAIYAAMNNFSEHPIHPISELEVFIGNILNKSGVQTHRQRERSIKLKDEFDRISTWTLNQMRPRDHGIVTGYYDEFETLERCLACVHVAREEEESTNRPKSRRRKSSNGMRSFRIVAVCALLMELERREKERKEVAVKSKNNVNRLVMDMLSREIPALDVVGFARLSLGR